MLSSLKLEIFLSMNACNGGFLYMICTVQYFYDPNVQV